MAVNILTELTWSHLPVGGVTINMKLLHLLLSFRRNLIDAQQFEINLSSILQMQDSGFPEITPNEGRLIASILGEVLRLAPEAVPRGSAAANLVICTHCAQPRTGIPLLEHCRCGNFFHPVCAGWGQHGNNLIRNGVTCHQDMLDCGCRRAPPNTISSSRPTSFTW
jgi:hypothetical protein